MTTTSVLVCDDSGMARKQMARALPEDWEITVQYAADGEECLEQVRQGQADLLFLDLNMPGLDGYGVLERIRYEELPTIVIVVSGDIQPDAHERVMAFGALAFIEKPTSAEKVRTLLTEYGLYRPSESDSAASVYSPESPSTGSDQWLDVLRELSNVAMGRAGDLLARLLNVFIRLPVPRVNELTPNELRMALTATKDGGSWSGACQGFIGSGLCGEALLMFSESRFADMANLLGYPDAGEPGLETEVLMDISSILTGAFLKGLGDQLDVNFGISHPVVLGTHLRVDDLLEQNTDRWQNMLAIELNYAVEAPDIRCHFLLLFAEEAIPLLRERLSYLLD
ncbi:response regulator [Tamilnaduibacter salinus]|nr:response regulator [Tamilnaduibacter salinus]